jgi:MFS-type transporter involved in bile tolerance (Atg22 family)
MAGFKLTKREKAWILYDVGNSAFTMMVSTLIPIFFNALAGDAGISDTNYLAYWGYAGSVATLLTAVIGPVFGTIADRKDTKKRVFLVSLILGAAACILMGFAWSWLAFLVIYVLLSLWSARHRRETEALAAMDNGLSEASFREIMHTMMREPDDETTDIAGGRAQG